jgi:chromosome segregation ATPase
MADVQRLLAEEQRERAEEADQLARMLKHVATADGRIQAGMRALADEREVSQQLGKSLTQKEEECVSLRGQVQDLEQRLEELASTKEQLIEARSSVGELKRQLLDAIAEVDGLKAARDEIASVKRALDESKKDATAKAQELERVNGQLKQANMKAFTANKQLESWKSESQRAIDALRKDDETKLAALEQKLRASETHCKALELEANVARRDRQETRARADSMRQHVEASIKILTLTSEALEAAETVDAEIQKLRAAHEEKRRQVLEQALGVRNALKRASEEGPTVEVSETDWDEDVTKG